MAFVPTPLPTPAGAGDAADLRRRLDDLRRSRSKRIRRIDDAVDDDDNDDGVSVLPVAETTTKSGPGRSATATTAATTTTATATAAATAAATKWAPHNDYTVHFLQTGQRPQNFISIAPLTERRRRLVSVKEELVQKYRTPPMFVRADLRTFDLNQLGHKFDAVLIDPPWDEYRKRLLASSDAVGEAHAPWTREQILALDLAAVAANPSFVWIWCGSTAETLSAGRELMNKFGIRRVEDIVWLKTNRSGDDATAAATAATAATATETLGLEEHSLLHHTVEHCLVGMRGDIRRSSDRLLVTANLDVDVIVAPEPPLGSTAKPEELYSIIERFANGLRRIELFGDLNNIRPGWVTVGRDLPGTHYSPQAYSDALAALGCANALLPRSEEIEELRPKSKLG